MEYAETSKISLYGIAKSEDGSPLFDTKIMINGFECGRGKGYSKKESHQKASKNALHHINNDRRLRDELKKSSTDIFQQ